MKKQDILMISSITLLLGFGGYYYMSETKRKEAFNVDTYGNPQGVEMAYQRNKYDPNEQGTSFGGKKTKHNRKSIRKNNSKKHKK